MSFKIRTLAVAVAAISSVSTLHAAGLDRSTQPSWAFTQDGTFAYLEHVTITPTIEGKDAQFPQSKDKYVEGRSISNMAQDYRFLNFGAKTDVNDTFTVGAYFDQPWGADVRFSGDNNFVGTPDKIIGGFYQQASQALGRPVNNAADLQNAVTGVRNQVMAGQSQLDGYTRQLDQAQAAVKTNPALSPNLQPTIDRLKGGIETINKQLAPAKIGLEKLDQANVAANGLATSTGGTSVKISSRNFTGMVGMKLGQNKNFQIYGGPALQKIEGDVHLRGNAYEQAAGYDAYLPSTTAYGWMAGVAYSKPEIALKAALTYRSEIDHDVSVGENLPALGKDGIGSNKITVTTPKSVNLDFQTGLNPTTLLTAKVRWVPWSDFAIKPKIYGNKSKLNLVSYKDDAWTADLSLGKKLSDKWAVTGTVGWDSGAGDPATSLGPVDGNWNVGAGARYNLTSEWSLSGGAKYLMFGDAKANIPNDHIAGDFKNNDGWVYGIRLSYQKK